MREAAKLRLRRAATPAEAEAVVAALATVCTPLTADLAAAAGNLPDLAAIRTALAAIAWP